MHKSWLGEGGGGGVNESDVASVKCSYYQPSFPDFFIVHMMKNVVEES